MRKEFLLDWDQLDKEKYVDEKQAGRHLLETLKRDNLRQSEIKQHAYQLVQTARNLKRGKGIMESFLEEFDISNKEGLALMCLAEALLRVPDGETADRLISEKIISGNWDQHSGQSDSWLVNASTLGLMLTGRVLDYETVVSKDVGSSFKKLVHRIGEPVIRTTMKQAMRIMGEQFVLGRTIKEAQKKAFKRNEKCSFDMLGEGARTEEDAERYFERYVHSIQEVSKQKKQEVLPCEAPGISVKLSALFSRYEAIKTRKVFDTLYPRLKQLCELAAQSNLNLCIDAEEADRLVLSLKLFEQLAKEETLKDWQGLGLAVQAYQKRCLSVIDFLTELASKTDHRFMVRLVKGAYWDTEIKHAQQLGVDDFSVWTTKTATDLNYLACAQKMLTAYDRIYPQFATHNAHSLASIQAFIAESGLSVEYQRLHGMGEALYKAAEEIYGPLNIRVYAPVGSHEDLLPYLVRRLLENGANTSFVNSFLDQEVPVESVVQDPFQQISSTGLVGHKDIIKPPWIYGKDRKNAIGMDITQKEERMNIAKHVKSENKPIKAGSLINGNLCRSGKVYPVTNPSDYEHKLGDYTYANNDDLKQALEAAKKAFPSWNTEKVINRAEYLRRIADQLEQQKEDFIALMVLEAGKTYSDCIAEIREAIDFCRFYAAEAEEKMSELTPMPGPVGETNFLSLHGRGVFVCISPWNFPLAIFIGQIAAALVTGNTVIAKPAEQTSLIAFKTIQLFHQAGIPEIVLQLVLGDGEQGAKLTQSSKIDGVVFTGSIQAARAINKALADQSIIKPLIAETGGLNGMFVDTTALKEQVVDDVILSAFGSAGQRCSALRILFLPEETADHIIEGITGAMDQLCLGNPKNTETDIGPVIDLQAHKMLTDYLAEIQKKKKAHLIKQIPYEHLLKKGSFFGPCVIEISSLEDIDHEVFGPVLHIIRYKRDQLDQIMQALTEKGYGLTLGVHSRLQSFAEKVKNGVVAGNVYINRNMVGAVVGVQPFGGEGLSGTGPKAGGPHYLLRFVSERTITTDITAQGGDPELLNLS